MKHFDHLIHTQSSTGYTFVCTAVVNSRSSGFDSTAVSMIGYLLGSLWWVTAIVCVTSSHIDIIFNDLKREHSTARLAPYTIVTRRTASTAAIIYIRDAHTHKANSRRQWWWQQQLRFNRWSVRLSRTHVRAFDLFYIYSTERQALVPCVVFSHLFYKYKYELDMTRHDTRLHLHKHPSPTIN